jgi:hypothetical protein
VIETPANAQVNAAELRQQAQKLHQGAKNAQGLMVLTGGATIRPLSINPNDAQFLESKNFTGAQIAAGIFGLHPEMVGLTHGIAGGTDITYQNLESRWVELTRRALQRWFTRFEFGFSNLLPGFASNGQYCKFNVNEYLRADMKTRAEFYQLALGGATGAGQSWMVVDEVRADDDLPPLPDAVLNPPPPAPVVVAPPAVPEPARAQDINVNVGTPDIIHIQPPNMRIENPVTIQFPDDAIPAPVVNVEQPQITVEAARAPDVHVEVAAAPPAEVTVNVPESKPKTTRKKVIRNRDQLIIGLEETTE